MFNIFKKKEKKVKIEYGYIPDNNYKSLDSICEPWTFQKQRIDNKNKDYGYKKSIKLFNEHKVKLNNQWVNPIQGVNSGLGSSNLSYYNYQVVDFIQCGFLAQDPLMNNIFDILSTTPFQKGGVLSIIGEEEDKNLDKIQKIEREANRFKLLKTVQQAVKSSFIYGGCMVYLDFGLDDLTMSLDLKTVRSNFKGFRVIDPLMCVAVKVNTMETAKEDYMEPKMWSITGLGTVHSSHLIKFEYNVPPAFLKPLCLYFGMPLTQLIKQDVANATLVSQGLANLVNKTRRTFIKMDKSQFAKDSIAQVQTRLKLMQKVENNFTIFPIGLEEDVVQLNTTLANYQEIVETFYNLLASKTGITVNKLMGTTTEGLGNGNAESKPDKNFVDKIETIQKELILENIKRMYKVVAYNMDKVVYDFDYRFNPMYNATEKETAETQNLNVDIAIKLNSLGVDNDECVEWLKKNKANNMSDLNVVESVSYEDTFSKDVDNNK